jgi:hypothetical protein
MFRHGARGGGSAADFDAHGRTAVPCREMGPDCWPSTASLNSASWWLTVLVSLPCRAGSSGCTNVSNAASTASNGPTTADDAWPGSAVRDDHDSDGRGLTNCHGFVQQPLLQ